MLLKYAGRHVLKRNPWVMSRCADLMSREFAPEATHRSRQEQLLARVFETIPTEAPVTGRAWFDPPMTTGDENWAPAKIWFFDSSSEH